MGDRGKLRHLNGEREREREREIEREREKKRKKERKKDRFMGEFMVETSHYINNSFQLGSKLYTKAGIPLISGRFIDIC